MKIKIPEIDAFVATADEIYEQIYLVSKREGLLIIAKALLNEYGKGADDVSKNVLGQIRARITELEVKMEKQ